VAIDAVFDCMLRILDTFCTLRRLVTFLASHRE
jgi:hypothetical protein